MKFDDPLKTTPVGAPAAVARLPGGAGMVTEAGAPGKDAPVPVYRVDTPALLSAIQNGVPGPATMPQGLISLGSVTRAVPLTSDTMLVWMYDPPGAAAGL